MASKVHLTHIADCELCIQIKALLTSYKVPFETTLKYSGEPVLKIGDIELTGDEILPSPAFTRILFENCVVRFTYVKTDGTEREALGTLCEKYIPEDQHPKSNETDYLSEQVRYYDLNVNAWRSFKNDNLEYMRPD